MDREPKRQDTGLTVEFVMLMALIVAPFAYVVGRAVIALATAALVGL